MQLPTNVKQLSHYRNTFNKFHLNDNITKFIINDAVEFEDNLLQKILKTLIERALYLAEKEGKTVNLVSVLLDNPTLEYPIISGKWGPEHNVAYILMEEINRLEISDKKINFLSVPITATVTVVTDLPKKLKHSGSGFDPRVYLLAKRERSGRSFFKIVNYDNLCLFYACELGRLHYDPQIGNKPGNNPKDFINYNRWAYIKRTKTLQKKYATELFNKLNLPKLPDYGLEHVQAVQNFYDENYPGLFRIIVVRDVEGPELLFKGPMENEFPIVLLLENNHFDLILNLPLYFFGKKMSYCYECEQCFHSKIHHRRSCVAKCPQCCKIGQGPCKANMLESKTCESCKKEFFNSECYEFHLRRACQVYAHCPLCGKDYRRDRGHKCGEEYCRACKKHHQEGECYITPLPRKENKPYRFVFFDTETTQDLRVKDGVTKHQVNYLSLRWNCTACADNGHAFGDSNCDICRPSALERQYEEEYDFQRRLQRYQTEQSPNPKYPKPDSSTEQLTLEEYKKQQFFKRSMSWSMYDSDEPLEEAVEWLLKAFDNKYTCLCYSHNGSRFDEHLLLDVLYDRYKLAPKITHNGNKIFEMEVRLDKEYANLVFRDTFLLMLAPLADLPSIFGLDCENKRYFPYLFNEKRNKDVELPNLPPIETYSPETMKPEKNKKFLQWYEQNRYTPFSLRKELCEYGDLDTEILMKAFIEFRRIIMDVTNGIDVLSMSRTIASMAMKIFRLLFLKENQFGVVPERGYEPFDIASDKAIKYLEWRAVKENVFIQHAGNIGEYQVANTRYKIDGYIEEQNLGLEFLGCYVHGCPECLKQDTLCINGKKQYIAYNQTQERIRRIENYGIKMEQVWECTVDKMLAEDKEMQKFFGDLNTKGRIEPRDAFMGGLTMPFKMLESADENTEISYFDIISLYPFINFTGPYPLGHPKTIPPTTKEIDVHWTKPEDITFRGEPIKGLVKVRIHVPKGLYVPVLPKRLDDTGRLLLCCCPACARNFTDKPNKVFEKTFCPHSEEERSYTHTTTTVELAEALLKGCFVTKLYRVCHYERWTDDPGESNPFQDYVKMFLKLKVENSEFPSGVDTDEKKEAFAAGYRKNLGIDIDITKVRLNPGFRYISKIMLNSLWGKFAQRNDQVHSKIFTSETKSLAEYFELLNDYDKYDIRDIIKINQDLIRVVYRDRKALIKENETSNCIIALYTTALARLRLISYMDIIQIAGGTLLYIDTDSIIFSHPKGQCPLKEGVYLGEMSREYPRFKIIRFAAGGAKQYGVLMIDADGNIEEKVKIRGITLDTQNAGKFRFEAFEAMVKKFGDPDAPFIPAEYTQIRPSKFGTVETRKGPKIYTCVNNKSLISKDWVCYPYGYQ